MGELESRSRAPANLAVGVGIPTQIGGDEPVIEIFNVREDDG